jgi:tRNA (cmo5U34)-methyltransferase
MSMSIAGVDRASVIASKFDSTSATYDAARAKLVPCFMRFYATTVALLPFPRDKAIEVLDLGAGTGLLAAWVVEAFPQAKMTLVDIAAAMLERAKTRLAGIAHSPKIIVSDYANEPLGGPYDAVVSALSIHHCDDEAKRGLFKHIFAALRPGGVFINAEQVAGPTPALDAEYDRVWHIDIRAAGASEDEIAAGVMRMREDRCAPLDAQLSWLREGGFADVDCRFKDGRFAVYAGRKPD